MQNDRALREVACLNFQKLPGQRNKKIEGELRGSIYYTKQS
jgi:hypothetical protein